MPDGPDRPWTRGRSTRWWLVIPADLVALALAAALTGAAVHETARIPVLAGQGIIALVLAWLAVRSLRGAAGHLEVVWPDGAALAALTWVMSLIAHVVGGGGRVVSLGVVLAAFLATTMLGWRWLYGFAKAQESLTPRAIQRRLDAQGAEVHEGDEGHEGDECGAGGATRASLGRDLPQ